MIERLRVGVLNLKKAIQERRYKRHRDSFIEIGFRAYQYSSTANPNETHMSFSFWWWRARSGCICFWEHTAEGETGRLWLSESGLTEAFKNYKIKKKKDILHDTPAFECVKEQTATEYTSKYAAAF